MFLRSLLQLSSNIEGFSGDVLTLNLVTVMEMRKWFERKRMKERKGEVKNLYNIII